MSATDAMKSTTMSGATEAPDGRDMRRLLGFPGRVAVSWAMASGVLAGGVLLAVLTLTDRASAFGIVRTSTALFVGGSLFGFVHGAVLGWMGRDDGSSGADARVSIGFGLMYVIPGLGVSWVVASLISQTVVAQFTGNPFALAGVAAAWIGGGFICIWAAREGARALRYGYARWDDRLTGTSLVLVTFAALLALFLSDRPELWGTQLRVGPVGALLLAGFATAWISGPGITLPLLLAPRIPEPRIASSPFPGASRSVVGVAIAALVGAALGGAALWLAPALGTAPGLDVGAPTDSLLLLAISRAVIDEVLFRLFIVTTLIWVFRRWHPLHPEEATTAAVLVAVVAQILFYMPAYLAQGLPDTAALLQQITWVTAVPAVGLGLVYVWRGLPAAVAGAVVFRMVLGAFGA